MAAFMRDLFATLGGGCQEPAPVSQAPGGVPPEDGAGGATGSRARKKPSTRSQRREADGGGGTGELERNLTAAAGAELNQQQDYPGDPIQRTPSGTFLPGDYDMPPTSTQGPPRGSMELSPDLQELVQSGEMTIQQAQELMAEMMGVPPPAYTLPPADRAHSSGPSTPPQASRQQATPDRNRSSGRDGFVPPTAGKRGGSPPTGSMTSLPQGTIPEVVLIGEGHATLPPQRSLGSRQYTMPPGQQASLHGGGYPSAAAGMSGMPASLPESRQESFHSSLAGDQLPGLSTPPGYARSASSAARTTPGTAGQLGTTRSAGPPQSSRQPHQRRHAPVALAAPEVEGSVVGGRLRLRVVRALSLRNTALGISPDDVSDPFVVAKLGRQEFKTEVIENNLNPIWNSRHFEFAVETEDATLELEVFNSQQWHANDSLGKMQIRISDLIPGKRDTRCERLDEADAHRSDRKRASLEVELLFLTATQLAGGGGAGQGAGQPSGDLALLKKEKKKPNWVPLPSFHALGPEAFEAPKPAVDEALVGQERRLMEQNSRACRLGQYDYSGDPDYNPNQEEVDKRQWKDDPFYGWRGELARIEHGAAPPPMLGMSPSSNGSLGDRLQVRSRGVLSERNERGDTQDMEAWHKDPFHGWLQQDKAGQPEGNLEKVQEAVMARQMMKLPDFCDADRRRFPADHREYAAPEEAAAGTRGRWTDPGLQELKRELRVEQRWKEDAFFGWLPGRGPDKEQEHHLQRPLHLARAKRLPSFSESPELLGITGRPEAIGILNVWVTGAFNLRYDDRSSLRGTPSACVRIRVGDGPGKVTSTVPTNADPRWNTPAMVFEVGHPGDTLVLEVLDLASHRPEQHLHHYFLGRVEKEVAEVQQAALEAQQAVTHPVHFREELRGAASQDARLDFQVSFQAYNDGDSQVQSYNEGCAGPRRRPQLPEHADSAPSLRSHSQRTQPRAPPPHGAAPRRGGVPRSNGSFRSTVSSELAEAGTLSVKIRCAYDLVNKDTGLYGDVSDPFVTMRLASQSEDQRKRTHTINNNLNPVWNTQPFLFPLQFEDDQLVLEVWDENLLSQPDFLGRLVVPLAFLKGRPGQLIPIRDKLQDIENGELEVELGYSPG